mmetsp:Transcript_7780/g.17943  ORF Transcript_7780/g.17943 Transcript_7780/m.17943 type:complete len:286 (-) Transcript_7780:1239-2096(-)
MLERDVVCDPTMVFCCSFPSIPPDKSSRDPTTTTTTAPFSTPHIFHNPTTSWWKKEEEKEVNLSFSSPLSLSFLPLCLQSHSLLIPFSLALLVFSNFRRDGGTFFLIEGVIMDGSVSNGRFTLFLIKVRKGVFHPFFIISIGIILVGMGTTTFLSILCTVHGRGRTGQQIPAFERLDEISIPDHALIRHLDVFEFLHNIVHLDLALREGIGCPIDGRVGLHHLLHVPPNLGRRSITLRITDLVQCLDALHSDSSIRITRNRNAFTGFVQFGDTQGTGTSKHDDIQ